MQNEKDLPSLEELMSYLDMIETNVALKKS